jgi:tetratricopeptide (TPR) repeat protein
MPDDAPGNPVEDASHEPSAIASRADLADALHLFLQAEGRRAGRAVSKRRLAEDLRVSERSVYAYLSGETIMPDEVLNQLLRLLRVPDAERARLREARDRLQGVRAVGSIPVLRPLPPKVRVFTGRTEQLTELNRLRAARVRASAVVISAVSGTAGVGKTALAVNWAHSVRSRFPDGCLYIDLHGYAPGQPLAPEEALGTLLRSLGVPDADIPNGQAELVTRYRTLLDRRRILIVLDNAVSSEQVRPLLPGSSSCFVVVTSRDDMAGLVVGEGAIRMDLDVLSLEESLELLVKLLGDERIDNERESAVRLAEQCARLPLALRVAAEVAALRSKAPLSVLVDELEQRRLDMLRAGGDERTDVRVVFSWSYRHLPADAARAFRLFGLHPGRDIDAYAFAALTGSALDWGRTVLDRLVRAHLLRETHVGRYDMHDLLRSYASELAEAAGTPASRQAATERILRWYLAHAWTADRLISPNRPEIDIEVTSSDARPQAGFDTRDNALSWVDINRLNLISAITYAADHRADRLAYQLAYALAGYLNLRRSASESLPVLRTALTAAHNLGNSLVQARILDCLGIALRIIGDPEAAQSHQQALDLYRDAGDMHGVGIALANLGSIAFVRGDYEEAEVRYLEAREISHGAEDIRGEGVAAVNLGNVYKELGRYAEAESHYMQAKDIFTVLRDRINEGRAIGNLGIVYNLMERYSEAEDYLLQALDILQRVGANVDEGVVLQELGSLYYALERYPEAEEHYERARDMMRDADYRHGEAVSSKCLADVCLAQDRFDEAVQHYREVFELQEKLDDTEGQVEALLCLGRALRLGQNASLARDVWRQALTLSIESQASKTGELRALLDSLGPDEPARSEEV